MAEQAIMLRVGADIVEVTKSLNQVEAEIKELEKSIKSLSGGALVTANKELDKLVLTKKALQNVGRTGFDQFGAAINRIGASATGATPALNSLGQVARDLPFGFIAIQNNLPIVIDQFTALARSSNGVGPALRSLGAALLGPAGLAFGFGAVTAGVTALIQKYGSLGAAITELSSAQDRASVAQRKLNTEIIKSTSDVNGEVQTLQNYIGILSNVNASQQQRTNAYQTLKREFPGVIQNMTVENALTSAGSILIAQRAKTLVNYINLKSKENALIELGKKANEAQLLAQKNGLDILQSQNTALGKFINNLSGGFLPGISALTGLNNRLETLAKTYENSGKDVTFFNQLLADTQNEISKLDSDITDPGAAAKAAAKAAKEAAAAQKEQQKEFAKSAAEAEKFREKVEAIRNELLQLKPIVIPIRAKAEITEVDTRFLTTDAAGNVVELPVKVKPILDLAGLSAAQGLDKFKLPTFTPDVTGFKLYQDELIKLGQSAQQAGGLTKALFDSFAASNKDFTTSAITNFTALNERVQGVVKNFNDFLAPAINTVFGALENGKSIPQALGQAFKALITQLALTVVKAAALAAILSAIPGLGPILGVASGGGFGKIFTSLLGFTGGGNVAAPTFAGVQGGAFGLQGQVVFTQRGSDLVGVLNNTNGQIRRVG